MADRITSVTVREYDGVEPGVTEYNAHGDGVSAVLEEHGIAIAYTSGTDAGHTLHFPWHVVLSYKTRNGDNPTRKYSEQLSAAGRHGIDR